MTLLKIGRSEPGLRRLEAGKKSLPLREHNAILVRLRWLRHQSGNEFCKVVKRQKHCLQLPVGKALVVGAYPLAHIGAAEVGETVRGLGEIEAVIAYGATSEPGYKIAVRRYHLWPIGFTAGPCCALYFPKQLRT